MTVHLKTIQTEEGRTKLEEIHNGNGTSTIEYLDSIRPESRWEVERIANEIARRLNLPSEISMKTEESAVGKSRRPAVLQKYPWFELRHLRDYLRFRTLLNRGVDFGAVLQYFIELQTLGRVSIVKVDAEKLMRPGAFGWRMIAVDLRVSSTGMLVEHYMTFRNMIEVNQHWLHKVYEAWRPLSTDDMTLEQLRQFDRDTVFSRHAYRELLFDGLLSGQEIHSAGARARSDSDKIILAQMERTLRISF